MKNGSKIAVMLILSLAVSTIILNTEVKAAPSAEPADKSAPKAAVTGTAKAGLKDEPKAAAQEPKSNADTEVDKTALASAIQAAGELKESDYTADSWEQMQQAKYSAIIALHNLRANQTDVNNAMTALNSSVQKLVDKTTAYQALENAIQAARQLQQSDYTDSSWQQMQQALDSAIIALHNQEASLANIEAATAKLNAAVKGVELIDKTSLYQVLASAIQAARGLQESDYTPSSWQQMQEALDSAIIAFHNTEASQADVKAATSKLNEAVKQLVDRTAASKALESAIQAAGELKESNYTTASWQQMQQVLASAIKTLHNTAASLADIETASTKLNEAVKGLEYVDTTSAYKALASAIQAANKLKESDYTSDSWQQMRQAVDSAIIAYHNTKASQADIEAAMMNLDKAVKELKSNANTVDKTALKNMLNKAEGLKKDSYTPDSYKILAKAMENAKAVINNPQATQGDVDNAYLALKKAMQSLVTTPSVKPVTPTPTTTSPKPASKQKQKRNNAIVQTGDATDFGIQLLLFLTAGGAAITLIAKRKKI